MSKRKDPKSHSDDCDERRLLEHIRQLQTDSATPEQRLMAMLLLQKLSKSSKASFAQYWPKAISIALDLDLATSVPWHIRGAAHNLLSFDCTLRFDLNKAEKWALEALEEGYNLAQYCLLVCRYLSRKRIKAGKQTLIKLMTEIETCLCESVGGPVAQHQCYLFALHLGLLYEQDDLIAKAEEYLQNIPHP